MEKEVILLIFFFTLFCFYGVWRFTSYRIGEIKRQQSIAIHLHKHYKTANGLPVHLYYYDGDDVKGCIYLDSPGKWVDAYWNIFDGTLSRQSITYFNLVEISKPLTAPRPLRMRITDEPI